MDKSKTYSESETDLLMISTDTLKNKTSFSNQVHRITNKFSEYIYNPDNNEVLRKAEKQWAKTLLFYFVFMGIVTVACAGAYALYLGPYVDNNHPRYQRRNTTLLGLGYRPMPDRHTTLIRFVQGKPESYKPFSDHVQAFLLQYENEAQQSEAFIDCSTKQQERDKQKACRFDITTLEKECTWQRDFGYDDGQPCVLLKLNKVFGWEPIPYETDFPPELGNRTSPYHIGISCQGENPIDEENIGPLGYYPAEGFSINFYPYLNQEGYRQPLSFVKFLKPTNGIVINVWCRAWAKNIKHHRQDDLGSIHFELLVD